MGIAHPEMSHSSPSVIESAEVAHSRRGRLKKYLGELMAFCGAVVIAEILIDGRGFHFASLPFDAGVLAAAGLLAGGIGLYNFGKNEQRAA